MKLVDNWQSVAAKAWSSRLALLAATLSAAEVALPYYSSFVPPKTMAILSAVTAAAAAIARIIAQPAISGEQVAAAEQK